MATDYETYDFGSTGTESTDTNVTTEESPYTEETVGTDAAQEAPAEPEGEEVEDGVLLVSPAGTREENAEEEEARKIFREDAERRAQNPNEVITREATGVLGGESFDVGRAAEEEESEAVKAAKRDAELRRENPNKVVYRTAKEGVGGASFDSGTREVDA